jgi:hypothetical protein
MYLSPYENNIFVLQFVFQNLMIFTHLLHVSLVQKIKKKIEILCQPNVNWEGKI